MIFSFRNDITIFFFFTLIFEEENYYFFNIYHSVYLYYSFYFYLYSFIKRNSLLFLKKILYKHQQNNIFHCNNYNILLFFCYVKI